MNDNSGCLGPLVYPNAGGRLGPEPEASAAPAPFEGAPNTLGVLFAVLGLVVDGDAPANEKPSALGAEAPNENPEFIDPPLPNENAVLGSAALLFVLVVPDPPNTFPPPPNGDGAAACGVDAVPMLAPPLPPNPLNVDFIAGGGAPGIDGLFVDAPGNAGPDVGLKFDPGAVLPDASAGLENILGFPGE
jgi:hypothetical protein